MPQLSNLVLTDRAAPPVNHTYTPRAITAGVAEVVESSGVPIGDNRVAIELRKTANGRYKAVVRGTFPITQTQIINGVSTPVVVRSAYATVEFSFAGDSSLQERKDVVGLIYSALAPGATLVNDTVTKLEGIY